MKIIQLVINPNGGGAERVATLLSDNLQKVGLDSVVVALDPAVDTRENHSLVQLNTTRLPPLIREITAVTKLRKYIKKNKITLIHAHCETPELVLALSTLGKKNVKIVITEHTDRPWRQHRIVGFITRTFLIRKKSRFVNCREFQNYWKQNQPLVIIQNYLRKDLEFSENGTLRYPKFKRIFIAQRLTKSKNINHILIAASKAKFDGQILIVGDGPQKQELEDLASQIRVNAIFLGFMENPWSKLQKGDLVISASEYEGEPMAICEAIALDAPILLNDIPGHKFAISNGFQKFKNIGELQDRLEFLMASPDQLSDCYSSKLLRDNFLVGRNPEGITRKWLNFYFEDNDLAKFS